jgi:hypothetical protein
MTVCSPGADMVQTPLAAWAPRGEVWHRSRAYHGPWGVIERTQVPRKSRQAPLAWGGLDLDVWMDRSGDLVASFDKGDGAVGGAGG